MGSVNVMDMLGKMVIHILGGMARVFITPLRTFVSFKTYELLISEIFRLIFLVHSYTQVAVTERETADMGGLLYSTMSSVLLFQCFHFPYLSGSLLKYLV